MLPFFALSVESCHYNKIRLFSPTDIPQSLFMYFITPSRLYVILPRTHYNKVNAGLYLNKHIFIKYNGILAFNFIYIFTLFCTFPMDLNGVMLSCRCRHPYVRTYDDQEKSPRRNGWINSIASLTDGLYERWQWKFVYEFAANSVMFLTFHFKFKRFEFHSFAIAP